MTSGGRISRWGGRGRAVGLATEPSAELSEAGVAGDDGTLGFR